MEEPEELPLITCKCKVKRCEVEGCMRCSRCGCDHNGMGLELLGKRGRRSKAEMAAAAAKRPRATRELRKMPLTSYAESSESEEDEREHRTRKYQELLSALGFSEERVEYIRRNIGAAEMRRDPLMWDAMRVDCGNYERKARGVVMGLYRDALQLVAEAVCGPEAAAASVEFFKKQLKVEREDKSTVKKVVADARKEVMISLGRLLAASKKGSVERRVMRAILCHTFSTREVEELGDEQVVPGFSVSRSIFTKSRRDYELLSEDGVFREDRTTRTRFDPAVVDHAIDALLARPNVSCASAGEKRTKVNGEVLTFPLIRLKRVIRDIYDDYKAAQGDNVVSRTTFYRLCRVFTRSEAASRGTDSITSVLLDDSVDRLVRIALDHFPTEGKALTEKLELVKDWLQHSFCDASTGCPQHDALFRLSSAANDSETRAVSCLPCLKVHAFQAYIKQRLGDKQAELKIVDDCFQKMDMFMAYQLRVLNQQTAIDALFETMKERCGATGASSEALVVIDFKRRVAPMYFRENPCAPDDGAGISWHSVMVRFWSTGGSADAQPVETKVYFDHVAASSHRKTAVVALLEAMIVSIKRDLPHITSITIQSDNASYYQSSLVTVLLPVLGAANGLNVSRFIHTETIDGKSPLDPHFVRAMKKAVGWVQRGNNCTTPLHLVEALASDGGLPNSVVQLIEYDSERLEQLADQVAHTVTRFSEVAGAANDIRYAFPEPSADVEVASFSSSPSYSLRVFAYSGIGDGIAIEIRPQDGQCAVEGGSTGERAVAMESEPVDDDVDCNELADLLNEDVEESELEGDEDCEVDHEAVFPDTTTGRMTRVKVVTTAQVRLRERKWLATGTTALLPVSRPDTQQRVDDEKDIFAYTKRSLHERFVSGRLAAFSSSTLPDQMAKLCDGIAAPNAGPKPLVHAGSARRPMHANPYGAVYVDAFREDIRELIKSAGQLKRWGKQAALRVLEVLQCKYPGRYDLPSETDIRAEIARRRGNAVRVPPSKDERRKQRGQLTAASTGQDEGLIGTKRRNPLSAEYSVFLEGLVAGKPNVKPLEALQSFREKFPSATDAPDDKVKAKVSNLKTKSQLQRRLRPQPVRVPN